MLLLLITRLFRSGGGYAAALVLLINSVSAQSSSASRNSASAGNDRNPNGAAGSNAAAGSATNPAIPPSTSSGGVGQAGNSGGTPPATANSSRPGGAGSPPNGMANQHTGKTAEQAWADVTRTLSPVVPPVAPPLSGTSAKKTAEQKNAEASIQAEQARQLAQSAKDFYQQFPADPKAAQARKVEAVSALRGVKADDSAQETAAVATARAYRTDPAHPAKDRFEVAVAMDRLELSRRIASRSVPSRAAGDKALVEQWRGEFGALPEIDTHAIAAARRADPAIAAALAGPVTRSPVAPPAAKAEARAIQDRAHLLGARLNLTLSLIAGGEFDLRQPVAPVTLLVVWSPKEADSLRDLAIFARGVPKELEIIYFAVGGTVAEAQRAGRSLPTPGKLAHVPAGDAAATAIAALKLRSAPYLYVLNRAGTLSDFGPVGELPALLTRAGVTETKKK